MSSEPLDIRIWILVDNSHRHAQATELRPTDEQVVLPQLSAALTLRRLPLSGSG